MGHIPYELFINCPLTIRYRNLSLQDVEEVNKMGSPFQEFNKDIKVTISVNKTSRRTSHRRCLYRFYERWVSFYKIIMTSKNYVFLITTIIILI